MPENPSEKTPGCLKTLSNIALLLLLPYLCVFKWSRIAWAGRDEIVADTYWRVLKYAGHPVPESPLDPVQMRVLYRAVIIDSERMGTEASLQRIEQSWVSFTRFTETAGLITAVTVIVVLGTVLWPFELSWAEEELRKSPTLGWVSIAVVFGLTWMVVGWLAFGMSRLVVEYGPIRWAADRRVTRVIQAVRRDETPRE